MPGPDAYVVGVDFGTLSGRALVVRVARRRRARHRRPRVPARRHGRRARRHRRAAAPGLGAAGSRGLPRRAARTRCPAAVADAGIDPAQVIGIGTDFTACTVLPGAGRRHPAVPARRLPDRPHAYAKLWKHHAAQPQADRINALARERGEPWLARYGGKISAEWQFAKALQLLEEDPEIYQRADRWIEAADWIIWQLAGAETRNACTAGYKGIRQDGTYPSREFLAALHPGFAGFADGQAGRTPSRRSAAGPARSPPQAAAWTGLPEGIAVAVGNVDAHVTPPAANAIAPGQMVAIMGTSTCHVMNGADAGRGAGHVRRGGRRHRRRAAGATRRARAASATSSPGSPTTRRRRDYHEAASARAHGA